MGDYHQAETKIQYFRDVFQDEETTKWLQKIMFGNPFLKYKVCNIVKIKIKIIKIILKLLILFFL